MSNQSNNEESLIQRIEELENEVQQLKSEIGFLKANPIFKIFERIESLISKLMFQDVDNTAENSIPKIDLETNSSKRNATNAKKSSQNSPSASPKENVSKDVKEKESKIQGETQKTDGELQHQSTKSQSEEQRSSDCSNQSEVVEKIVTILYAKDSNDGFLRCVDHLELRKSVYRLELVNSKEAKLFLCDKEDDKKRIIKEGVRILNSICDVTKKTNTPTEVLVKTHGIARCIEDNKWQVEKKIEVVLQ